MSQPKEHDYYLALHSLEDALKCRKGLLKQSRSLQSLWAATDNQTFYLNIHGKQKKKMSWICDRLRDCGLDTLIINEPVVTPNLRVIPFHTHYVFKLEDSLVEDTILLTTIQQNFKELQKQIINRDNAKSLVVENID